MCGAHGASALWCVCVSVSECVCVCRLDLQRCDVCAAVRCGALASCAYYTCSCTGGVFGAIVVDARDPAQCKELGITALHIKLRGTGGNKTKAPGPGAQAALRALARSGIKIGRIGAPRPRPPARRVRVVLLFHVLARSLPRVCRGCDTDPDG